MTDQEYIRRSTSTREQRQRRREMRRNLTILAAVLLMLLAILLLVGAGTESDREQEDLFVEPVVVTASPVKVNAPEPTTALIQASHYSLTDDERSLVERVVFAESGNQSLAGQMAVAQCILNTAVIRDMRPDEVVLEPNQYAYPANPDRVTESVREAVRRVFDEGETVTDEPIRFFYAPKYSKGSWHESALEYVLTIGGHRFFKEKDHE